MEEPTVVRVPAAPGSRLLFSFGLGSEIRVIGAQHPSTSQGGDSHELTRVTWGQVASANRAISYSTMEQYSDLQRTLQAGRSSEAVLTKASAFAHAVREGLDTEKDKDPLGLLPLELAVWQLLEIFYVDAPRHEGDLGEDLVLWLSTHHDSLALLSEQPPLSARLEELQAEGSGAAAGGSGAASAAQQQPDYWPLMRRLVALGRVREALALLDLHEARRVVAQGDVARLAMPGMRVQVELVETLHVLLRRLPRLLPSGGRDPSGRAYASRAEFEAARSVFLGQVSELASKHTLLAECAAVSKRTADGVLAVLRVLAGEPLALAACCQDWLELLAATLLHAQPGCDSPNQLRGALAHARAAWAAVQQQRGGGPVDGTLLLAMFAMLLQALCSQDMADVIAALTSNRFASPWLLAHALELLAAYPGARAPGSLLSRAVPLWGCDEVEYFRLAWAVTLLPAQSSWPLALEYLAWCSTNGAAAAERLMDALPVDSRDTRALEKAALACRRLGLGPAAAALCRRAGVDALCRGALGAGVAWLARAGDAPRLAAALAPALDAVEAALACHLGSYRAAALRLGGGDGELEGLLEWLGGPQAEEGGAAGGDTGSSSQAPGASADGDGSGAPGAAGPTRFLCGMLRLSSAMGALAEAREAPDAAVGCPAALSALAAARRALLSLAARRAVPRRAVLPTLFYTLPLLEAPEHVLSPSDMAALLAWARGACASGAGLALRLAAGSGAPQQPGGAVSELLSAAAALGVPERYAQDVAMALLRGVARAHAAAAAASAAAATGVAPPAS